MINKCLGEQQLNLHLSVFTRPSISSVYKVETLTMILFKGRKTDEKESSRNYPLRYTYTLHSGSLSEKRKLKTVFKSNCESAIIGGVCMCIDRAESPCFDINLLYLI